MRAVASRVTAAAVTVDGQERRTLGPGDWFGELALIEGGTRTATVTATTDGLAYGLTSWQFRPLVEAHPALAWPLLGSTVGTGE